MTERYVHSSGIQPTVMTVADDEYAAVSEGRIRIRIGAFMFVFMMIIIVIRLAETSLLSDRGVRSDLPQSITTTRADITDRNGEVLATTLQTYSLYAEPRKVWNASETTQKLISVLPDLDAGEVMESLSSDRAFKWIARGLTPKERQAVFALGLPGLDFRREPKRVYPRGQLAAHILGYSDTDMHGLSGAEKAFEAELSSENAPSKALSIDMRAQHALADTLREDMALFQADSAAGIVLDVKTGEIMAMVSLPDYDPNVPGAALPENRYNHAAMSTYELGSVFKPITMALALETQTSSLTETFPVQKPFKVSIKYIRDDHKSKSPLAMPEILAKSSNRGTAMMALRAGADAQKALFKDLGLFDRVPYELAESAKPQVQPTWPELTVATTSYGHGISVTPLALAVATGAMLNGGNYIAPTILRRDAANPINARRVLSENTAQAVTDLMRYVVTNGTGRNARAEGYGVMGKTGTADKPSVGGYDERRLVTSFISGFPYSDPRYVVMITYDEPKALPTDWGYATAGWNAAKTTKKVITRIGPILGVERSLPAMAQSEFTSEGALP